MKFLSIFLCLPFICHIASGQNKTCNCPENELGEKGRADKIFSFKNGRSIGLCGSMETRDNTVTWSEFILFQCGSATIVSDWDATQSCKISMDKDTLIVQEFYGLALDKDQRIIRVPFYITKYYFTQSSLKTFSYFRKDLPKYRNAEISKVLMSYNRMTRKSEGDSILLTAHKLFWAYVSGSKIAGKYLDGFEKKFGPFDGAVAEEYQDLWATYQHYRGR